MKVLRAFAAAVGVAVVLLVSGCGNGHASLQEIRDQSSRIVPPGGEHLGGEYESAPSISLFYIANDGAVYRLYGTNETFDDTVAFFENHPDLDLSGTPFERPAGRFYGTSSPFGPDGQFRVKVRVQDHPFEERPDGSPLVDLDWLTYVKVTVAGPPP